MKTPIKAARVLELLTGNQAAAKKIAEHNAQKAGIEDRDQVAELVRAARTNASLKSSEFKIQLAAIVDGIYGVTMATYAMEGDGATVFFSWELWEIGRISLRLFATYPTLSSLPILDMIFQILPYGLVILLQFPQYFVLPGIICRAKLPNTPTL